MTSFRISKLKFSFGKNSIPLEAELKNITILVGPNNSGKSATLREIQQWCTNGQFMPKLLSDIELEIPNNDQDIDTLFTIFKVEGTPPTGFVGEFLKISLPNVLEQDSPHLREYRLEEIRAFVQNKNMTWIRNNLTPIYTISLDGKTRFNLIRSMPIGDLKDIPRNLLSFVFRNDSNRNKLSKIIFDEFGYNFYLDPTSGGNLNIVLSKETVSANNEKSLSDDSIKFFKNASQIGWFGDGIQAFTGILLSVLSLPHKIILVDEPEAFLHPPSAKSLGGHLTSISRERDATLITATHSADFLMGCLENSKEVTIVRLTYDGNKGTAMQLSSSEIMDIMKDPLLRSSDTLSSVFHKASIVTESDADRVFYAEINRRLEAKQRGIEDAIFLNAQNKQTIHRIVGALRKIGVASVGLYDLDVIKLQNIRNTTLWNEILTASKVPSSEFSRLETERAFVEVELEKLRSVGQPDPFKKLGLPSLPQTEKIRSYKLLEELKKYGIFIIDLGELERWLLSLNAPQYDKKEWIVGILNKLGMEEDANYVHPQADDVWKFIDEIGKWTNDPNRLGM